MTTELVTTVTEQFGSRDIELTHTTDIIDFKHLSGEESLLIAKDLVNYAVGIVPAFYQLDSEFKLASGKTNTARDKEFHLVVVDKCKQMDFQAIACVTDTYGTVSIPDTYQALLEQLEESELDFRVINLFVSGNGGQQQLRVAIKGMTSLEGVPDEMEMIVNVTTSVDGTKHHGASLMAYNKTGDYMMDIFGKNYKLSARHTRTIGDRTIDFQPIIFDMISNWEELVQPAMTLMNECEYSQEMAEAMLEEITKSAGMAQKHRNKLTDMYRADRIRTNAKGHSLYKVNMAISQYINEEMKRTPDLQEKLLDKVAKRVDTEVHKAAASK